MSITKRGRYYHYRFNSKGKMYAGVCVDSSGRKAINKREAEIIEKTERQRIARLEAQKSIKGIVENFKQELAGGEPLPLCDAWSKFIKKPRKKQISDFHKEIVENRWRDFTYFIKDKYPEANSMHQVTPAMAEEYISFVDASGPYTNFHLAPIAKNLDLPISTLKTYMKRKDWPGGGSLAEMEAFVEKQTNGLAKKHKAKRKHYKAPTKQDVSAQARNNYLAACKMIFAALGADASCPDNPFEKIPRLETDAESREAFTPEELKLIAENAKDWVYTLFMVGVNTGLREGDICTLRWSEVDLKGGWISRRMNKTGKTVDVPIMPALNRYLSGLSRDSEYCFPELAERYLNKRTTIGNRVNNFLSDLGITTTKKAAGRTRSVSVKDVHSCRHTFVYLAASHNIPLPVVQKIVGHVSQDMTTKYSNHAQRAEIAASMARVPDYMTSGGLIGPAPASRVERVIDAVRGLPEEKLEKVEALIAAL